MKMPLNLTTQSTDHILVITGLLVLLMLTMGPFIGSLPLFGEWVAEIKWSYEEALRNFFNTYNYNSY